MVKQRQLLIIIVAAWTMNGCTAYHPKPLSMDIALVDEPGQLIGAGSLAKGENNTAVLSIQQLTTLALYNSPKLKASRIKSKIAGAQLYAAGLLPDPSLSVSSDKPMGNPLGVVNAWGLGLGYDLLGLITRQVRLDIQGGIKKKVSLELLWQEWQVVQQARSLAVKFAAEVKKLVLLKNTFNLYQQRYRNSEKALAAGDITLDVNGADLTGFVDISSQINKIEQAHNETHHALNQLLGLSPDVKFVLKRLPEGTLVDTAMIKVHLKTMPHHRPDLMALQAAYTSQESRVHSAILSQFPSLGIGINRARDTGGLHTIGVSISLNLPLFSGNRGNIAVERATRELLKAEFESRLIQAAIDVDRLSSLQLIIVRQQKLLKHYLPRLNELVGHAREAYQQGDMEALMFLNLETTWLNKKIEEITLDQLLRETEIALQMTLAIPSLELKRVH